MCWWRMWLLQYVEAAEKGISDLVIAAKADNA